MADLNFGIEFDVKDAGIRGAASVLAQLRGELAAGQRATFEFESSGQKLRATIENLGTAAAATKGAFGALSGLAMGVAGAFAVVASGITAGAKAIDSFGDSAIEAFGERSGSIRAYTTLLGDAKKAQEEYAKANQLAAKTDLTAEATQKAQQQLLVAGLRGPTKDALLLGGLDLASIAPGDKNQALSSYARAVSQIQQKGKLQSEELLQLAEGASLGSGKVKEQLQAILGVKNTAAVDSALQKGQVTSDQGLLAIQKAILAQLGTAKLGEYATGSSGSLTGLLSNRDEAFQNLLRSFDSEVIPGVQRYKEALSKQGETLDTTTDSGQRAVLVLQDFSNTSLALKAAWTDFTTGFIDSFTSSYTAAMGALGVNQTGLNNLGDSAKRLGEVLGNVGTAVAVLVRSFDYMAPLVSGIGTGFEVVGRVLASLGEMLADLAAGDFKEVRRDYERLKASFEDKPKTPAALAGPQAASEPYGPPASAAPSATKPGAAASAGGTSGGGKGGKGGGQVLRFEDAGVPIAELARSMPLVAAAGPAPVAAQAEQVIEVTVVINDANKKTRDEMIEEGVTELARRIGRLVRTPSPGRS